MSVDAVPLQPSAHQPKLLEPSRILSDEHVRLLAGTALPPHLSFCSWGLAYATNRDGFSLHTLYRKVAGKAPTVVVIKDSGTTSRRASTVTWAQPDAKAVCMQVSV